MNERELTGFIQHLQEVHFLYGEKMFPTTISLVQSIFFRNGNGYEYRNGTVYSPDNHDISAYDSNQFLVANWMISEVKYQQLAISKVFHKSKDDAIDVLNGMIADLKNKTIKPFPIENFTVDYFYNEFKLSGNTEPYILSSSTEYFIAYKFDEYVYTWMITLCLTFIEAYLKYLDDFPVNDTIKSSIMVYTRLENQLRIL